MSECGIQIEGQLVSYPCILESGHEGPHMSPDNQRSVRERERYEEALKTLTEFQGQPETTAERYTANPTPVPQTREEIIEAKRQEVTGAEENVVIEEPVKEVPPEDDPRLRRTTSEDFEPQPTKTRPGDQPLPQQREGESVQDRIIEKMQKLIDRGDMTPQQAEAIIASMQQSKDLGIERYGTALQTFNGRDTLQDAIDEARDLFVYLNALQQARETSQQEMVDLVVAAVHQVYEDQGGGVMTVDDIVKVAVVTLRDSLGI